MQMKRLLVVAAVLLMSAATWAQQALWGTAPVVSPEIHSDNTVTFRLKAPKAVSVQVTGDFQRWCLGIYNHCSAETGTL